MRKYDIKNKRNIGIILGISVLIIIMFSLVIKLFLNTDRNEYKVSLGTLVFDKDKSIVNVKDDAYIKMKWNKEYYLKYNKQNIELGNTAISYNENTGEVHLYGRYYEINSSDEINITDNETIIKNTLLTKFYKLADRKYLIVDKSIKSADGLLDTTDFLIIELDKVGNATLTNHKVNLKTFSETTIVTSNYTFDIASEILTYGSDKIDLKKIIGSSNTFTKDDLIPEDNTSGGNGGSNGVTENTNTSNENINGKGNGNSSQNREVIEEVKKEAKNTSVIAVTSTVSKIIVDYVVYDPKKEYVSVYMEVKKEGSDKIDTIYLDRNETTYEITENVFPNTSYEITFKYSYVDENGTLKLNTFSTNNVTTKKPSVNLKITRISSDKIYYLISNDNSFQITSGILTVYVNGNEYSSSEISIEGNTFNYVTIEKSSDAMLVELKLSNIKSDGIEIKDLESSDKFRY